MTEERAVYDSTMQLETQVARLTLAYDELLQHAVTHQQLDKSDTHHVGGWRDHEGRIEALELRQNLVESPVMLRIATALETLAKCVEVENPKQYPDTGTWVIGGFVATEKSS
jgi:hypothetical protein